MGEELQTSLQTWPSAGSADVFSLPLRGDGGHDSKIVLYAWLTSEQFKYYQQRQHEHEIFAKGQTRTSLRAWRRNSRNVMNLTPLGEDVAAPGRIHSKDEEGLLPTISEGCEAEDGS